MKIIILGAGQVGTSVAANLVHEANDITVVDQNPDLLRALQDRFDLSTVLGNGAHPDVLIRAGAEDADMIIAVTNSDETNMVACQVAYTLFRTPTKIARVRSPGFLEYPKLFGNEALPIDVPISPEALVTDYILRLIENPGSLQVLDFAGGRVRLVAVKAHHGGPMVGQQLRALYEHMPDIDARVAAIYRQDHGIQPRGDTVIEVDDEVFFIAAPRHIRAVMGELRRLDNPYRRLVFAGGGNIGTRLAKALEGSYRVKIIERDLDRCKRIAEDLEKTIVLRGDAADEELLQEENIENTDVFCAVTNDDEVNVLAAMLAKRLGAHKVMALINRPAYVDLVQHGAIDIAISPQQATIGTLLRHVRRGDVVMVHSLRRGAAEAIEAIAHGDRHSSKVVGRTVGELDLAKGTSIGAIVRGEEVIIAHHDTRIEAEDHVILFLQDKRRIAEIERLFQVGITFL
ncbi:Trk system potassium transporter TrkA [Thiococcus pfennigii]|jgi:trk system potassium uptake protein TrkA|uniref:Trk system potassium transporter TrkA n=1 Tax=Thiococcus pfennigii TaxID=1057 RepID=UPI00190677E5|nr:Trk system potassium transporter TrkA [Thiococcus pfennigii]MBK1731977.1 Trk system potassium transport protein TrkA [Thiococcus pfennigii]